jgi:hypothetical protein
MENILEAIKNMEKNMQKGFEDQKSEITKLRDEITKLKEDAQKKEKEWKEEKAILEDRITKQEEKLERKEKQEIRNNIVIKNIKFKSATIKEEVKTFIQQKLETDVEVIDTIEINDNMTIVKLENWEQKKQVMKNKSKLRGEKIYIDGELTRREREIQKKIVEVAKDKIKNGDKAKVGYKKLILNGKVYIWDEKKSRLTKNS